MSTIPELLEEIGKLIISRSLTHGETESIYLRDGKPIRIYRGEKKPHDILLYPIQFSDPFDGPTVKSWDLIEKILRKLERDKP